MTLIKKIIIGWLGLCVVVGLWSVITGNTSEKGALQNEFTDICEDAFEENKGLVANKFFEFAMNPKLESRKSHQPLMLKVEYDDDIEPIAEAKRGLDRRELNLSCQQKLTSNYKGVEPWAVIMVHRNKHGDYAYEISEIDIYDTKDKVWWSSLP